MENRINNSEFPVVSVIMPAFNMQKFIEEAIRSVINQTFTDWELLVIDDCSDDSTCSIVERLAAEDERITLIKNENNIGVAAARNRGLDLCRGSYVAFLDSDDVWHSEKLETQLKLIKNTGADICYSSYSLVDVTNEKVREDYLVPQQVKYEELLKENVIGCSTVVLDVTIAQKYRFNEELYHEDYVLWLFILRDGYMAVGCPEVLVNWRFFEDSRSFNKFESAKNRWRIYRRCLKLSFFKSIQLLVYYALAGLKKYRKIALV